MYVSVYPIPNGGMTSKGVTLIANSGEHYFNVAKPGGFWVIYRDLKRGLCSKT